MATVTRRTNTYDASADTMTTTETTIDGAAIRVRGNPLRYRDLDLKESEAPTLLFVPETYGDTPRPGDTIDWNDITYTVRDVEPLAPDGVTIQARMVVSR